MADGRIRIIGGEWRGRKLKVPSISELRPTPNRVRETVFNWLQFMIAGAHCLDPFAGSGALGFEALSRGAAFVVMVDASIEVVKLLQAEAMQFETSDRVMIYCASSPLGLKKPNRLFDIVFLDPPFQQNNKLLLTCHYLEENQFLADLAYIYLEANKILQEKDLPSNWRIIKSKKAGQVAYHLAERKRKEVSNHAFK